MVCNHVLRAAHGANWRAAPLLLLPRFCHPVMQLFYPAFFRARFQKFFCSYRKREFVPYSFDYSIIPSLDDLGQDVNGDWEDDGAVVFCRDAAQGLQIAQLGMMMMMTMVMM